MTVGRHRGLRRSRGTLGRLRSDLEWCEADRARLADRVEELERQLKSAQRALRSEADTTRIPIVLPDGDRLLTTVVAPGGASFRARRASWGRSD